MNVPTSAIHGELVNVLSWVAAEAMAVIKAEINYKKPLELWGYFNFILTY